jgi:hypothetical protein
LQRIKRTKTNADKGAVFSIEAAISILCFAMLLTTINYTEKQSLKELIITQQADDLLRVWSAQFETQETIQEDAKKMFGNSASVYLNDEKILSAKEEKNSISTEGIILNELLEENTVRIIVYYK